MRRLFRLLSALAGGLLLLAAGCGPTVRVDRSINHSPDGAEVGFQHGGDGVFVARDGGAGLEKIYEVGDGTLAVSPPLWSPVDKRLIFTAGRATRPSKAEQPLPAEWQELVGQSLGVELQPITYTCLLYEAARGEPPREPVRAVRSPLQSPWLRLGQSRGALASQRRASSVHRQPARWPPQPVRVRPADQGQAPVLRPRGRRVGVRLVARRFSPGVRRGRLLGRFDGRRLGLVGRHSRLAAGERLHLAAGPPSRRHPGAPARRGRPGPAMAGNSPTSRAAIPTRTPCSWSTSTRSRPNSFTPAAVEFATCTGAPARRSWASWSTVAANPGCGSSPSPGRRLSAMRRACGGSPAGVMTANVWLTSRPSRPVTRANTGAAVPTHPQRPRPRVHRRWWRRGRRPPGSLRHADHVSAVVAQRRDVVVVGHVHAVASQPAVDLSADDAGAR